MIGEWAIVSLFQAFCQSISLDTEQNPPGAKSLTTEPKDNATQQEPDSDENRGALTGEGQGTVSHYGLYQLPRVAGKIEEIGQIESIL
ncbi:Hypp9215 [Branchiostoma lanceolatum]|uniref:Hypp9215 protein n=1 Tax=Branchiostoma lanceolatum TaxID=7740 RepID=A0A8J9ZCL5_BRALA|nr:Hypp9215 [Branchiostoma lanceolatum]